MLSHLVDARRRVTTLVALLSCAAALLAVAPTARADDLHHITVSVTGSGRPLTNARVVLYQQYAPGAASFSRYQTRSGTSVDFLVPDGVYKLQVVDTSSPATHTSEFYPDSSELEEAHAFAVAGGDVALASVELASRTAVTGRLVNSQGAGIGSIWVRTSRADPNVGTFTPSPSSSDGTFTLWLDPDTYFLQFTDSTRVYRDEWYDDADDQAAAKPVIVPATPITVELGDVHLSPESSITGRVTRPDGSLIEDALVYLTTPTGKFLQYAYTGEDGVYRFTRLPVGRYLIYVEHSDRGISYRSEYYDNAFTLDTATTITLGFEEIRTGADVQLEPGRSDPFGVDIAGVVTDPDGKPLADVVVQAGKVAGHSQFPDSNYTLTDDRGHYFFTNLDYVEGGDNSWALRFSGGGPRMTSPGLLDGFYGGGRDFRTAEQVQVPPVGQVTVDYQGTTWASGIRATFRTEDGQPATGRIGLWTSSGSVTMPDIEVGDGGTYFFRQLEPGHDYRVMFTPLLEGWNYSSFTLWWEHGYDYATTTPLRPAAGEVMEISGTAVDHPIPLSPVSIVGQARVGGTLSAVSGSWNPQVTTLTYEWVAADGSVLSTELTPAVTPAMLGAEIRVRVTGRAHGKAFTTTSEPVTVRPASPPALLSAPAIAGVPRVGRTLTATTGTWDRGATATYTTAWFNGNHRVGTGAVYVVKPSDAGDLLVARVTATSYGSSAVASSPSLGVDRITSQTRLTSRLTRKQGTKPAFITFTVKVTSPGTTPDGRVTISSGGVKVVANARLVRGRLVVTLKNPRKGTRTYTASYLGSSSTTTSTSRVKVTVP